MPITLSQEQLVAALNFLMASAHANGGMLELGPGDYNSYQSMFNQEGRVPSIRCFTRPDGFKEVNVTWYLNGNPEDHYIRS